MRKSRSLFPFSLLLTLPQIYKIWPLTSCITFLFHWREVYDLRSMAYFDHTCTHSHTPKRATCTALQAACKHLCDLTMLLVRKSVLATAMCILYRSLA